MEKELFLSSKTKDVYPICLTKEELEAIPILVNMAMVYSWELYKKTETDKFYEQHKENIDLIEEYHNKGYQGILATGINIEGKCKNILNKIELDKILEPFMNV